MQMQNQWFTLIIIIELKIVWRQHKRMLHAINSPLQFHLYATSVLQFAEHERMKEYKLH